MLLKMAYNTEDIRGMVDAKVRPGCTVATQPVTPQLVILTEPTA